MAFMPHWPLGLKRRIIQMGTDHVREALPLIGNPQLQLPPVIHIAGTNGKGSTLAYLKAFFEEAGYKVHRYSSPHLFHFNERIHLAGEDISDAYQYQILEECRIKLNHLNLSFFEATTLAGFLAFSRSKADILLLETGMGGRLDATNIIDSPRLTLITSISFDHIEYLGNSLALIAAEKAGIIKKKVPCVVNFQAEESLNVIEEKAEQLESPLYRFGKEWGVMKKDEKMLHVAENSQEIYNLPGLHGDHQISNAGLAIMATHLLSEFNIKKHHIESGLQKVKWPGRLHPITSGALMKLLPEGFSLWFDGGHNEAGGYVLTDWIISQKEKMKDIPIYLIVGLTEGKNRINFIKPFRGFIEYLCGVNINTEPCAMSAEYIADEAQKLGIISYSAYTIEEALITILQHASKPGIILIAGSLYLANDITQASKSL